MVLVLDPTLAPVPDSGDSGPDVDVLAGKRVSYEGDAVLKELDEFLAGIDIAVVGLANGGSCTSWTIHDALRAATSTATPSAPGSRPRRTRDELVFAREGGSIAQSACQPQKSSHHSSRKFTGFHAFGQGERSCDVRTEYPYKRRTITCRPHQPCRPRHGGLPSDTGQEDASSAAAPLARRGAGTEGSDAKHLIPPALWWSIAQSTTLEGSGPQDRRLSTRDMRTPCK